MTYNEVLHAIKKVTRREILVKENSKKEEETRFYNQVRISITQGKVSVEPMLNKLAPDIKPWTVEEFLEK